LLHCYARGLVGVLRIKHKERALIISHEIIDDGLPVTDILVFRIVFLHTSKEEYVVLGFRLGKFHKSFTR